MKNFIVMLLIAILILPFAVSTSMAIENGNGGEDDSSPDIEDVGDDSSDDSAGNDVSGNSGSDDSWDDSSSDNETASSDDSVNDSEDDSSVNEIDDVMERARNGTRDDSSNESENETEVEDADFGEVERSRERSGLNVTREKIQNKTRILVQLSNGNQGEIKIMPLTASETAIFRLGLGVCSEENNCTIELKEVGQGNEIRAAYEVQAEKEVRLFGFLKTKMTVGAEIDADSGEIIKENRPWWAFIATEN